jgi:hypothetical protein
MQIRGEIPDIADIVSILNKLNTPYLLENSQEYSNYFNFSIGRWAQRRLILISNNFNLSKCSIASKSVKPGNSEQGADSKLVVYDRMLACLTLGDIATLSKFELPAIANPDQIGGHIVRDVEITPGALPKGRLGASIAGDAALFFVLIYFWVFAREAARSSKFPVDGTLFGAFSKSRLSIATAIIALWIPFLCAVVVAIEARSLLLAILGILILLPISAATKALCPKIISDRRLGRVGSKPSEQWRSQRGSPDA